MICFSFPSLHRPVGGGLVDIRCLPSLYTVNDCFSFPSPHRPAGGGLVHDVHPLAQPHHLSGLLRFREDGAHADGRQTALRVEEGPHCLQLLHGPPLHLLLC